MDRDYYINFMKYVRFFMKNFYNIEVNGRELVPDDSNYLLAGNHLNILDSWLLMYIFDEDILRFMVDKKLYRYKSWENFFTKMGTFSIDPNSMDLNAIKSAVNLLKDNEKVVIFPEGKTHKITEEVPFKGGVSKIASLANKPIIPFGISGSYIPFTSLSINFGEPIILDRKNKDEWDTNLENKVRSLTNKKH